MSDTEDQHTLRLIIDFKEDAVITAAHTPTIGGSGQFSDARWAGILLKTEEDFGDSGFDFRRVSSGRARPQAGAEQHMASGGLAGLVQHVAERL